jgi:hypothetical protein
MAPDKDDHRWPVPVIPSAQSAALFMTELVGTDPRIRSGEGHDGYKGNCQGGRTSTWIEA